MIRAQVLEHLPGARDGKREGGKGDVNREAIEKNKHVKVIERKKMTQSNTSSPRGSK